MASANNLEARARERKRRERLRKKRIRMCISLTVMAALLILIITAIATSIRKAQQNDTHSAQPDNATTQQTPIPSASVETSSDESTTITASIGGTVTGSYTINDPSSPDKMAELLGIPAPSEENDLIQIIADANQKKHCYFTFEDGPSAITPQILDVLRKYNIKATFFMTGDTVSKASDIARRVYEEGHLIANRITLEDYDSLYASTDSFMTALKESEDKIKAVIDSDDSLFRLVRFPGGTPEYTNSNDYKDIKLECMDQLAEEGYYYCDWNTSNGDDSGSKSAKQLYKLFTEYSKGYNNLIVLMHDSASKQSTADALGDMIEYLIQNEYTFHTLDDIDYNPSADEDEPLSSASPRPDSQN